MLLLGGGCHHSLSFKRCCQCIPPPVTGISQHSCLLQEMDPADKFTIRNPHGATKRSSGHRRYYPKTSLPTDSFVPWQQRQRRKGEISGHCGIWDRQGIFVVLLFTSINPCGICVPLSISDCVYRNWIGSWCPSRTASQRGGDQGNLVGDAIWVGHLQSRKIKKSFGREDSTRNLHWKCIAQLNEIHLKCQ